MNLKLDYSTDNLVGSANTMSFVSTQMILVDNNHNGEVNVFIWLNCGTDR